MITYKCTGYYYVFLLLMVSTVHAASNWQLNMLKQDNEKYYEQISALNDAIKSFYNLTDPQATDKPTFEVVTQNAKKIDEAIKEIGSIVRYGNFYWRSWQNWIKNENKLQKAVLDFKTKYLDDLKAQCEDFLGQNSEGKKPEKKIEQPFDEQLTELPIPLRIPFSNNCFTAVTNDAVNTWSFKNNLTVKKDLPRLKELKNNIDELLEQENIENYGAENYRLVSEKLKQIKAIIADLGVTQNGIHSFTISLTAAIGSKDFFKSLRVLFFPALSSTLQYIIQANNNEEGFNNVQKRGEKTATTEEPSDDPEDDKPIDVNETQSISASADPIAYHIVLDENKGEKIAQLRDSLVKVKSMIDEVFNNKFEQFFLGHMRIRLSTVSSALYSATSDESTQKCADAMLHPILNALTSLQSTQNNLGFFSFEDFVLTGGKEVDQKLRELKLLLSELDNYIDQLDAACDQIIRPKQLKTDPKPFQLIPFSADDETTSSSSNPDLNGLSAEKQPSSSKETVQSIQSLTSSEKEKTLSQPEVTSSSKQTAVQEKPSVEQKPVTPPVQPRTVERPPKNQTSSVKPSTTRERPDNSVVETVNSRSTVTRTTENGGGPSWKNRIVKLFGVSAFLIIASFAAYQYWKNCWAQAVH